MPGRGGGGDGDGGGAGAWRRGGIYRGDNGSRGGLVWTSLQSAWTNIVSMVPSALNVVATAATVANRMKDQDDFDDKARRLVDEVATLTKTADDLSKAAERLAELALAKQKEANKIRETISKRITDEYKRRRKIGDTPPTEGESAERSSGSAQEPFRSIDRSAGVGIDIRELAAADRADLKDAKSAEQPHGSAEQPHRSAEQPHGSAEQPHGSETQARWKQVETGIWRQVPSYNKKWSREAADFWLERSHSDSDRDDPEGSEGSEGGSADLDSLPHVSRTDVALDALAAASGTRRPDSHITDVCDTPTAWSVAKFWDSDSKQTSVHSLSKFVKKMGDRLREWMRTLLGKEAKMGLRVLAESPTSLPHFAERVYFGQVNAQQSDMLTRFIYRDLGKYGKVGDSILNADDHQSAFAANASVLFGEMLPEGLVKLAGPRFLALTVRHPAASNAAAAAATATTNSADVLQPWNARGRVVLDLGCGLGRLALQTWWQFGNVSEVVGIEITQSRIRRGFEAMECLFRRLVASRKSLKALRWRSTETSAGIDMGPVKGMASGGLVRRVTLRQGSLFDVEPDLLARADVVFLATDFGHEMMGKLRNMLSRLSVGTRLLSYTPIKELYAGCDSCPWTTFAEGERFLTSWAPNYGHAFHLAIKTNVRPRAPPPLFHSCGRLECVITAPCHACRAMAGTAYAYKMDQKESSTMQTEPASSSLSMARGAGTGAGASASAAAAVTAINQEQPGWCWS